jgi:hypothetical protein
MKKIFGVTLVLAAVLFLSACFVRITGPCLGYGCPPATSGGVASATNTSPQCKAQVVTARNTPPAPRAMNSGK